MARANNVLMASAMSSLVAFSLVMLPSSEAFVQGGITGDIDHVASYTSPASRVPVVIDGEWSGGCISRSMCSFVYLLFVGLCAMQKGLSRFGTFLPSRVRNMWMPCLFGLLSFSPHESLLTLSPCLRLSVHALAKFMLTFRSGVVSVENDTDLCSSGRGCGRYDAVVILGGGAEVLLSVAKIIPIDFILFLSICLSVCVCLSVPLSLYLHLSHSVFISTSLSDSLSTSLSISSCAFNLLSSLPFTHILPCLPRSFIHSQSHSLCFSSWHLLTCAPFPGSLFLFLCLFS